MAADLAQGARFFASEAEMGGNIFDARLSADGTVACATCHDPARAFTDGRPVSVGIHGRVGQRNALGSAACCSSVLTRPSQNCVLL